MPIHDWSRVAPGIFHHFHGTWLFELAAELNRGVLPEGYYALGEQVISGAVPDVLTLECSAPPDPRARDSLANVDPSAEPLATMTLVASDPRYPPPGRVIAVRHVSGDRVVAIVEIVSPANKKEATELGSLVEKTVTSLAKGIHVVIVDLHPPGPFDRNGIHNAIWEELGEPRTEFDPARPFAVVSYHSRGELRAFIEPLRAGERLPDAPLFLAGEHS